MDKIQKSLAKLSVKEQKKLREILEKLSAQQFSGLGLKKLKGRDDIYRARSGKIRVIYRQMSDKIFVLAIERRNDNTYNF